GMERIFGPFFRRFNRLFQTGSKNYSRGVANILSHKLGTLIVYALLLAATFVVFRVVPPGFVPLQDKQYLVSFAQLPQGATLDRTEKVIREMSEIAMKEPGVESAVSFPGLSINGFINNPSTGIVFVTLKPFEERTSSNLSGVSISDSLQKKFSYINDAYISIFPPPPVQGLGTIGGFKLQIEDRADLGYNALDNALQNAMAKAKKWPELQGIFSSFKNNTPQLYVELDRTKAMQLGVDVQDVFDTLQIYLGSLYINDFNKFGRV